MAAKAKKKMPIDKPYPLQKSKCIGILNVFAAPWKNSDIILVARNVEFHVHRLILCLHSPVFEAMLNGEFKEAKQDKITLEGKDPSEMTIFLKLLYPSKFFDSPLNEGNVTKVLALAEEYQAEAVTKQCFAEIVITVDNALDIAPHALMHDQSVYKKCIKIAQKEIKCENLKKSMPKFEPDVREEILSGKCKLLEDALLRARDNLIACLNKLFYMSEGVVDKWSRDAAATSVCCFSHEVKVHELRKAKECKACLLAYRAKFCDCVPSVRKYPICWKESRRGCDLPSKQQAELAWSFTESSKDDKLVELLQDIDDLLSQIKNQTDT